LRGKEGEHRLQLAGMPSGRYMAYSPSPSTTPHSPRISGLRAPSVGVADQEKYLAELLVERHKLSPFIPVIPHGIRLLNQELTSL
jgi:protein quaking